jgi:hypothetical protein
MQLEKTVILNFVLKTSKVVFISENENFICDNNGANFFIIPNEKRESRIFDWIKSHLHSLELGN